MASRLKTAREIIGALSSPAIVKARPPIRAYHGSPHDFPKFDLSKIGTGEGAQAYGHGLYFAGDEAVARHYRDALTDPHTVPLHFDGRPIDTPWNEEIRQRWPEYFEGLNEDNADAMEELLGNLSQVNNMVDVKNVLGGVSSRANGLYSKVVKPKLSKPDLGTGHMYEVDIDADPDRLLNWDRPLGEQPDVVRKAVDATRDRLPASAYDDLGGDYSLLYSGENRPGQLLNTMEQLGGRPDFGEGLLRDAGIPGIRYLDGSSRSVGEGTSNYVIFDDKLIDIRRKYEDGGLVHEPQRYDEGGTVSLDDIMSGENLAATAEFNAQYPELTSMTPDEMMRRMYAQDRAELSAEYGALPPALRRLDATARGINSAIPFSQDIRAGLRTIAGAGEGDYLDFGDRFTENKAREASLDDGALSEYPLEYLGGMVGPSVMMPGLIATQAVTLPGKLTTGAAVGGALGYASGLGEGVTADERLSNANESALFGGGIGLALPAAGPVLRTVKRAATPLTATAVGTAGLTVGSEDAEANIYGVFSKLADRKALAKARSMAAKGAEREEIVGETNWFKDLNDGKWKYHSQPKDLSLTLPDDGQLYMIEDALKHPELFEAYPQLKGLAIKSDKSIEGASFSPRLNRILIGDHSDDFYQRSGGELGSALHETQHAIQHLEGFTPGTSPRRAFDDAKKTVRSKLGNSSADKMKLIENDAAAKEYLSNSLYHFNAGEEEARRAERFGIFGRRPGVMPWTTDITGYSDEALIGNRNPNPETLRFLINRANSMVGYADGGEVEVDHVAEIKALADTY